MFHDEEMSFQDWQGILLASLEVGGDYKELLPKVNTWLKNLANQRPLSLPLDELSIPFFFELTLPKIINQILSFRYIQQYDEIKLITQFLKRVVKIIPISTQYLNTDLTTSIANIFNSNNVLYKSNTVHDLHEKMVKCYQNQEEMTYAYLDSLTSDNQNTFINFFALIISINTNLITYVKKGQNNNLADLLTRDFISFLEPKFDNPKFISDNFDNLTNAFDLLSKFIIKLELDDDSKIIAPLYDLLKKNLSNPCVGVPKFIAHCLSTLCSNPRQARIILQEQKKDSNSVFDNIISSSIQAETLKELQPYIQLQIEQGIINLESLIQFWNTCNESEVLFNNQVCIDLFAFSLKYLDIDSINYFLLTIQIDISPFYFNVLSKSIYELQNLERTVVVSMSSIQLLLSLATSDENAKASLLNLIKMKLNNEVYNALITDTLPLFNQDKNIDLAYLIIKGIIESSSDPRYLLDSSDLNFEDLFKIMNDNNRFQIISLLFQYYVKIGSKPNTKLIKDLLNSNSREETWIFLKDLIKNKNYQNSEDLKELYQIANKEDPQTASHYFYKFLKALLFKINNNFFIEEKGTFPVANHHMPFKIKCSSIIGLELMLKLYQFNKNQKTVSSSKKFLLLLFKNWEANSSVDYLNEQIQLNSVSSNNNGIDGDIDDKEPLIRSLELVLDYILQTEVNSDPEDLNAPRHFYPRNFLLLQIFITSIYTNKNYTIHFDQQKTLKNLKERIAERENQNVNSVILENFQPSQENLSLFENGVTNNSRINIKINTYAELIQMHSHYQASPSYLFYNGQFGDVLLNLMDENNAKLNSIIWKILQLLPTAKSVTDIFIKNDQSETSEDLISENFLSQFLKTENNCKKLYYIQALSQSDVNIFSHSTLLNALFELFNDLFYRDDIICLFNSRYNEEYFPDAQNIMIELIRSIPYVNNDDLITTIFELINRIAKENPFGYLKESFEIFEKMNNSFWKVIVDFIQIVSEKQKIGDDIYDFCEPYIINISLKSRFPLYLISKLINLIDLSQANNIYLCLINHISIFIENSDKENESIQTNNNNYINVNDNDDMRIFSDILECVVSILSKFPLLVKTVPIPTLSLFKLAFGRYYNLVQKSIFSILSTYIEKVSDDELKNSIFLKMNEMINYPLERWNYNPSIFSRNAPYTGLRNLGATCFVNSIFQQLFHLFPIRYSISTYKFEPKDELLTLQDLFIRMAFTARSFADTSKFIDTWHGWNNSLLNSKEQEDSVEFFLALINSLPSKITDLFKGEMKNFISGIGVKFDNSSTETFFYLNISIKNHKDIESSLNEFVQDEQLSDYECDLNKQKISVNKYLRISKLPAILVIQLSRFEYNFKTNDRYKINDRFEFPLSLNIKKLCEDQQDDDAYFMYNLNGIVIHTGVANGGHYISYIRKGNDWWSFNDIEVTKVNEKDVLNNAFGGKEGNSSAYVLFYTKNDYSSESESAHRISFDTEFDYSNEVNGLEDILKDNDIFEKSQALFGLPVIEFIQTLNDPILNLSFFIRVLCHSRNYQKANQFVTNLIKLIQADSIDLELLNLIKCANYLIDHLIDIIDDYMNCSQEVSILNLTEIIKFCFINLDKMTSLNKDENEDDNSNSKLNPHELSLSFFDKFVENAAKKANSYRQLPAMLNLIKSYVSNYPLVAYKNGWVQKLLNILDAVYSSQISRNQNILINLNLSDLFVTLNTILSNVPELDVDISNDLLKHATDIKVSEANREVYSKLLMTCIVNHDFNINQVKSLVQINFESIKSKFFESLVSTILNPFKEKMPNAPKKEEEEETTTTKSNALSSPSIVVTINNVENNKETDEADEIKEKEKEEEGVKKEENDGDGFTVKDFDTKELEIKIIKDKILDLINRKNFTEYELSKKLTDEIKAGNSELIKKIVYYSPYIFADKLTGENSNVTQNYFSFYKSLFEKIEKEKDKDELMASLLHSFDDYLKNSVRDKERIQDFISKNSSTTPSNYTKLYNILVTYTKDYSPERADDIIEVISIIDKTKRIHNDPTINGLMAILVSFPRESLKGKLHSIVIDFFLERISSSKADQIRSEIDPIIKIISSFLSIDIQLVKNISLPNDDEYLIEVSEVLKNSSMQSLAIKYITNTFPGTIKTVPFNYMPNHSMSENSRKLFKFYLLLGKKSIDEMNQIVEKMINETIEKFDSSKSSFEIKIKFFIFVSEVNNSLIDNPTITYYFNEFIKILCKPSSILGSNDIENFRKFIDIILPLDIDENFNGIELSTKFFTNLTSKYQIGTNELSKKVFRWLYLHTPYTRDNIVEILTEIISQKSSNLQSTNFEIALQYCVEIKNADLLINFYETARKNSEKDKVFNALFKIFTKRTGIKIFEQKEEEKVDENKPKEEEEKEKEKENDAADWLAPFVKVCLQSLSKTFDESQVYSHIFRNMSKNKKLEVLMDVENRYLYTNSIDVKNKTAEILLFLSNQCKDVIPLYRTKTMFTKEMLQEKNMQYNVRFFINSFLKNVFQE